MTTVDSDVIENYVTERDSNLVRPFTKGLHGHQGSLATILLYQINDATPAKSINGFNLDKVKIKVPQSIGIDRDQEVLDLKLDGANPYYAVFNNFSLLAVSESTSQIVKVHMNFGANWNAFFFGEKPKVYNFRGIFLDTKNYPYYQEFMMAYDQYLAGRKCVENNMLMKIMYDGKILEGYMLDISIDTQAESEYIKTFNFTVLVGNTKWVRSDPITNVERMKDQLNVK